MTSLKCKNCGAPLDPYKVRNGFIHCAYCGGTQTVSDLDSDRVNVRKKRDQEVSDSKQEQLYRKAMQLYCEDDYYSTETAMYIFKFIIGWKDSAIRLIECEKKLKTELQIKRRADEEKRKRERRITIALGALLSFGFLPIIAVILIGLIYLLFS